MPAKDQPVKDAITQAIGTSRRGRKKVIPMVQRKTPGFSSSRIRRVYEQQGFVLSMRLKRRRGKNPANPSRIPLTANKEWAIDFMHDSLENGRSIRSLNILDPFNRECKGMFISHSIPARRLIEFLERAIEQHGRPQYIRSDNGPEFISKRFQVWMRDNEIGWQKIRKGNPQENCFVERFNRTAREDLFDASILLSVEHAQELASDFVREYNHERPHESLNNKTPHEHAA